MPGGNGAGSGGILCLDGLQQAGVIIQNCFCRTAAEAEHRGAVKMRGQIFYQLIPVRAAAQLIQHLVELLIQCKDLFLPRPLNVHLPQRHILPQTVELLFGQHFAGHPRQLCFQHCPEMPDLFHQPGVDEGDIGADLGPDLDQPPLRQLQLCFPEGGAADPQLLAQLRLVEFFSGFQTGVDLKTKKMASIPQSQAGSRAFSHKILLWLQKQAEFSTFQLHARGAACSQYSTNRFGLSRFLQKMQQKAKHTGRDFCCRSRSWTF